MRPKGPHFLEPFPFSRIGSAAAASPPLISRLGRRRPNPKVSRTSPPASPPRPPAASPVAPSAGASVLASY